MGETTEVVPQPARLPRAVYLQTELVFSFPGNSFSAISYAFAITVVVLFTLLCYLFPAPCCRKRGDATGDALSGEASSSASSVC